MSDNEQIEKIAKISRSTGTQKIVEATQLPDTRVEPNKDKFDESMKTDTSNQVRKVEHNEKTSLMDEIRSLNRKVDNTTRVNPQELADQSKGVIAQIEQIKHRLSDPQLEIKGDYKRILRNKLEHIDDNLKIALDKAGLEYIPPELLERPGNTPIERFLNLLTGGQDQLKQLGGELQTLADSNKNLSPANLLMVQVKVNYIQQEIEFFTSLLNKALESTKTIMNVQV